MAVEFRPAATSDRAAILELFEAAFKSPPDPADFAWKYDANPHPAVSVVAFEEDRAVGFIGAIGTRYRGAGVDQRGNSLVDVMTWLWPSFASRPARWTCSVTTLRSGSIA